MEENLEKLIKDLLLTEDQIKKALSMAINQVLRSLKTTVAQALQKETRAQYSSILGRIKIFKASTQNLSGDFSMLVFNMPAILLQGVHQDQEGVKAKGYDFKNAFIRSPRRRRPGKLSSRVLIRTGKKRFPIKEISIPVNLLAAEKLGDEESKIIQKFKKQLEIELKKIGGLL